jgi:hypothetical protein
MYIRFILRRTKILIFRHVISQDFYQLHVFDLKNNTFCVNDTQIYHLFVNIFVNFN